MKIEMHSFQVDCLQECVRGGIDILANLPNGYGKSLVFQLAPIYHSLLRSNAKSIIPTDKVLIIIPLNAIIGQQLKTLKLYCVYILVRDIYIY